MHLHHDVGEQILFYMSNCDLRYFDGFHKRHGKESVLEKGSRKQLQKIQFKTDFCCYIV